MQLDKLAMVFQFEKDREYYYEVALDDHDQFAIYVKFSLAYGLQQISTIEFLKAKNSLKTVK